jgi:hypothetical protein
MKTSNATDRQEALRYLLDLPMQRFLPVDTVNPLGILEGFYARVGPRYLTSASMIPGRCFFLQCARIELSAAGFDPDAFERDAVAMGWVLHDPRSGMTRFPSCCLQAPKRRATSVLFSRTLSLVVNNAHPNAREILRERAA